MGLYVKCPLFLSDWNLNFSERFLKDPQIPDFTKIRILGAELLHGDEGRQKHADITTLIVTFRNSANVR